MIERGNDKYLVHVRLTVVHSAVKEEYCLTGVLFDCCCLFGKLV